jgi:hypothetical protein
MRQGGPDRSVGDLDQSLEGVYISRIKKIAPETDRAHRNKVAITVAFGGRTGRSWRKLWRAKKPAPPATVSRWRCFLVRASASAIGVGLYAVDSFELNTPELVAGHDVSLQTVLA